MTSIGSPSPFFLAGKKAYSVDRSLRFDDDQSSPTRLTRTVQSGGNLKKFTVCDIGCGYGKFLEFLRNRLNKSTFQYQGCDLIE